MHIYVYINAKLFSKNMIFEYGIAIATSILGLKINAFWERALRIHPRLYGRVLNILSMTWIYAFKGEGKRRGQRKQ